jgi:toxin ParE1/3/4
MHVRLTGDAVADLANLKEYLEPKNPQGYARIVTAIFTTMAQLENFPLLGREGRVEETYEIAVPRTPFLIIYSINDPLYVDIDRMLHGKQEYPPKE